MSEHQSPSIEGINFLNAVDFNQQIEREPAAIILDTRSPEIFCHAFIPGSVNIGGEGQLSLWASSLLPEKSKMLLVADRENAAAHIAILRQAGFQSFAAYTDGLENWMEAKLPFDLIIAVEPDEVAMDIPFDKAMKIIDVRMPAEFAEGHVKQAISIPLDEMSNPLNLVDLEEDQNIYLYCGSGYRSVIAASLLKRQGMHNIRNIVGGFKAITNEKRIETEKDKTMLN